MREVSAAQREHILTTERTTWQEVAAERYPTAAEVSAELKQGVVGRRRGDCTTVGAWKR